MTLPPDYQEDFPHFDLSVLTDKQLRVIVMRYRDGWTWRRIAVAEGVTDHPIRRRHERALVRLRGRISHHKVGGM